MVTRLQPIERPRMPPMLAMNQIVGTFWSRFTCEKSAMYGFGDIATSSNDADLRDGGVLDVDVDQGEVLPGVTVHQVDQLGVAAECRK